MRTIGRRLPDGIGPDRVAMCSYCGVQWRRSQLTRDTSGNLACPDDAPGLDIVSLSEGNARLMRSRQPKTVGPTDGNFDDFISPASPGFVSPNGPPASPPDLGPTGELSVLVNQWLRADSVTLAGTRATLLFDKSGRGNSAWELPGTGPTWTQEDATLGGNPTVTVDGATQWMRVTPNFSGGQTFWVWMVYKQDPAAHGLLVNYGPRVGTGSTSASVVYLTAAGPSVDNAGAAAGSWARAMFYFNPAGTASLLVKSTFISSFAGGPFGSATLASLFAAANGTSKWQGSLAELLVTSDQPTVAEMAALDAYGIARYGGSPFA